MNLPSRLIEIGRATPSQEALVYHNQRISYGQLKNDVDRLANGLQQLGIKPEDRVLIALSNCPEFVIAYYAVLRVKGIVVAVNPAFTRKEIGAIIKDCQPAAVFTTGDMAPVFQELNRDVNIPGGIIVTRQDEKTADGLVSFNKLKSGSKETFPSSSYGRNDPAVIAYTSDHTGLPKGAVLTHHNLYSNALTFARMFKMSPQDRILLVSPVYHIAVQTCVINNAVTAGSTIVIHDGWAGPEPILDTIDREKITFFFGPPAMYSFLVGYPNPDKYDAGSLRVAFSGGSPLSEEIFNGFLEKYGIEITEGYGLSETSALVTSSPMHGPKKIGSIGKPIPGVEVNIFDYEGREVPPGQVGEIVVRGPNVMAGYYNKEEETRWAMRNGWFHTGDLAYMDPDGYLFIVDRKKALIIRGGINVNPREVEEVLSTHPAVFDAAVVGVPDAVMGEEIMAFVLLRKDEKLEAAELQDYCKNHLAKYKIPRYIRFVENLPKTTSGKLMRRELQRWATSGKYGK